MSSRNIKFNRFFDQKPSVAFIIPGNLAAWFFGIVGVFVIIFVCIHPYMILLNLGVKGYVAYWGMLLVALVTFAVLIGDKEHEFIPKFHKPRDYVTLFPKNVETKAELKPRIGSILTGADRSKKRRTFPSFDITDLVAPIQIDLQGLSAGGYLCEYRGQHKVVFAYDFEGFPSTISPDDAIAIAEKIESGFRDFKGFETLTLYYGSFADCSKELKYIDRLSESAKTEESKFLLSWRRRRMINLTRLKKHCPKTLRLFFTYTFDAPTEVDGAERVEKLVETAIRQMQKLRLMRQREPITTRLEGMLKESFEFGFLFQNRFFRKVGFIVRSLTWEEAWETGWKRVNNGPAPDPGLVLRLDETGFYYDYIDQSGIPNASLLFQAGAPTFHKDAVYLPGRDRWVGGAVLQGRPNREWDESERLGQMQYAVEAILSDQTNDTELLVQFSTADQAQAIRQAKGRTKESNTTSRIASSKGRKDRAADIHLEASEDAESALLKGATIVKTAWVANVYRTGSTIVEAKQNLNRAILSFTGESVFNGNIVKRESGYYDTLWAETLPFTMRPMLQGDLSTTLSTTRFERRIKETTEATIAFMPLLNDCSKHDEGVPFIAKDSRTPLYFNPFSTNPHGHMLLSGFTGSGKTQLFQCLSEWAYCANAKNYFFDADKGTGAGALEDFTEQIGGSYFKASRDNSNLFEGTDWRKLSAEKEEAARAAFKSFLISSLKDLSITSNDPQTNRHAKDILSFMVDSFLTDDTLKDRYRDAWDYGLGSQAWGNIPCLPDFVDFSTFERLPFVMQTEEMEQIVSRIRGGLTALMTRDNGRAISLPSTFDRSARYMVFSLGATGDDDDKLPLILSAQGTMLFGAFESDRTLIGQDEASRLFPKFPSIASNCADLYAMGRSLGIWAMLIGQDLNSIAASKEADTIFQNTNCYLTGYIKKDAIEAMVARGIPEHLLRQNLRDDFFPPSREGSRRWLISQGDRHFHADLYPSFASVAMTMNGDSGVVRDGQSLSLQDIRRESFERYRNKYQACSELAKELEKKSIDAQVRYE